GGRVDSLRLSTLGLTGRLPAALGNLTAIRVLNLPKNSITGFDSTAFAQLQALERLNLRTNDFTGSLPLVFTVMSSLKELRLFDNAFSGAIPAAYGSMASLELLYLDLNDLVGPLPTELGQMSALEFFEIDDNLIDGPIPSSLENLSNLRVFDADNNDFTGSIPAGLAALPNLEELDLSRNDLTGPIPPGLLEHPGLTFLDLSNNALEDTLTLAQTAAGATLSFCDLGANPQICLPDAPAHAVFGSTVCGVVSSPACSPRELDLNVLLAGAMRSGTQSTDLNANLPRRHPYASNEYAGTSLAYAGPDSAASIPSYIVDWLEVVLHTGPTVDTAVERRAALLTSAGQVVDVDGVSPVAFLSPAGSYYVTVLHRNHRPATSSSTVALAGTPGFYDFTLSATSASDPLALIDVGGQFAIAGGEYDFDGLITSADLVAQQATPAGPAPYARADWNLDGVIDAGDVLSVWVVANGR
ncbi:MAG: leucine-rich repeat domain-containing protein, partial [Bacteroidota bacterium]